MKVKNYRILLFTGIILIIISTFGGVMLFLKSQPIQSPESKISTSESEFMYLVKKYDQKIGVFKYGQSSPYLTLDVYVSTLPKKDQQSLESGIKVFDNISLERLIEDLES